MKERTFAQIDTSLFMLALIFFAFVAAMAPGPGNIRAPDATASNPIVEPIAAGAVAVGEIITPANYSNLNVNAGFDTGDPKVITEIRFNKDSCPTGDGVKTKEVSGVSHATFVGEGKPYPY